MVIRASTVLHVSISNTFAEQLTRYSYLDRSNAYGPEVTTQTELWQDSLHSYTQYHL